MRVLLVDDYAPLRRLARIALADQAFTIIGEAADGIEAVSAARQLRPELVLIDFQMPRLDGISAARLIKALPLPPCIVLWTSDPAAVERDQRIEVLDAIIAKGCTLSVLVEKIMSTYTQQSMRIRQTKPLQEVRLLVS